MSWVLIMLLFLLSPSKRRHQCSAEGNSKPTAPGTVCVLGSSIVQEGGCLALTGLRKSPCNLMLAFAVSPLRRTLSCSDALHAEAVAAGRKAVLQH